MKTFHRERSADIPFFIRSSSLQATGLTTSDFKPFFITVFDLLTSLAVKFLEAPLLHLITT
jgi:hypothetical protein